MVRPQIADDIHRKPRQQLGRLGLSRCFVCGAGEVEQPIKHTGVLLR